LRFRKFPRKYAKGTERIEDMPDNQFFPAARRHQSVGFVKKLNLGDIFFEDAARRLPCEEAAYIRVGLAKFVETGC
jgi:hypothetical protein